MNKYETRTQQKKNAIIYAALEQFNQNGFGGASIKDIAAKAHVSQVSIYNYFGSKDALVAECAKIIMERVLEKAREILTQDMSFKEKLILAMNLCSGEIQLSLSQNLSEIALSDPVMIRLLQDSMNELKLEVYKEYIELGKKEKAIDSSISTVILLKFLDALTKFDFDMNNLEAEQHTLNQLFLYGILGK